MMVGVPGRAAGVVAVVLAVVSAAFPEVAWAEDRSDVRADARTHYDKGAAAYALGRYADAAVEFEQAFTLKPDPAILYNAAQAYRLAGKRERALDLYRNYLRVYGRKAEHAADVEWHISELEKLPAADRHSPVERANLTTPATAAPATVARPTVALAAPPPAASASLVSQPAPGPAPTVDRPVYQRWWFWTGVGAVVVGAAVVGIVLATRKSTDCGPGVAYCASTGL
jgi:tetratricopeptide (TPR) repeat protein